jgi:hypothetical protein
LEYQDRCPDTLDDVLPYGMSLDNQENYYLAWKAESNQIHGKLLHQTENTRKVHFASITMTKEKQGTRRLFLRFSCHSKLACLYYCKLPTLEGFSTLLVEFDGIIEM